MNIWSKMITALRGGVNEAGEAIIDATKKLEMPQRN